MAAAAQFLYTPRARNMVAIKAFIAAVVWYCWPRQQGPVARHTIASAYVICTEACDTQTESIRRSLLIPQVEKIEAHRGDVDHSTLPLYTRHIMRWGRHDHMQLPNAAAIGCLLSHADIWARIANQTELAAVFEEDAIVTQDSLTTLEELWHDVSNHTWSVLMLDPGHINTEGPWLDIGTVASTCRLKGHCTWLGTRGYVITPQGARALLDNLYPLTVQVDSLIGLVAAFDPNFQMMWTRQTVIAKNYTMPSKIFDGCVKCMLPTGILIYAVVTLTLFGMAVLALYARRPKTE